VAPVADTEGWREISMMQKPFFQAFDALARFALT